ncbi:hypothetical protein AK830_g6757 [Neonectria ditissima]|uniref:Uncharacterized protein n=1 Tax=Neonectria ditissima TaxID=78410 RepID=A0A0P7BHR8_9HYPO|nr:hypothetical protein AK830_g6757 [Neonectria ditissima]
MSPSAIDRPIRARRARRTHPYTHRAARRLSPVAAIGRPAAAADALRAASPSAATAPSAAIKRRPAAMYSAGYGFANSAAASFNNAAPPQQPGAQPTGQQVMYNQQQQFAGMATPQGAFAPGANPQMMPGGPAGMMPNAAMPHMAANGQMAGYQQQFPGAPYGQVVPSSTGPQGFSPNYMMAGGMQGFPMNQAGMPQQPQMMHRLPQQLQQQQQPPNPAAMGQVGTPQRPPSAAQGTPNNAVPSQPGQFSTPQPSSQSQTPTNQQQPSAGLSTPQTPTFSVNQGVTVNGGSNVGTPLSPGTESRDKERFALLLDINHELLYESIQIQATQQELKKEHAAEGNGNGNGGDKKPTEEETLFQQDYLQCMRRLQANLSYMAALADRKPEVKAPPCPAYLSAPPLNLSLKLRPIAAGADGAENNIDPVADRDERDRSIKDLYSRLQAVFPGFDPKKEPLYRMPAQTGGSQGQKPGGAMSAMGAMANQASPTGQRTPQMTNMPAPPMHHPGMP